MFRTRGFIFRKTAVYTVMVWYSVFCMHHYKQSCRRKSVFFHPQDCLYWCMQNTLYHTISVYTGCPTHYRTRHFFNNFTTNKGIATKFEADLPHCVRNVKEKNAILFKFRCNIFIGVRIIKEMPGSVASGTPCIYSYGMVQCVLHASV